MKIIAALVIGFYVMLAVCIIIRPIFHGDKKENSLGD
jgi:hypothetical protein